MPEIEFTDRYQALGIIYPDPKTICKGHCEGLGRYPVSYFARWRDLKEYEKKEWWVEHEKTHKLIHRIKIAWMVKSLRPLFDIKSRCDGWHFIICDCCKGTGKK